MPKDIFFGSDTRVRSLQTSGKDVTGPTRTTRITTSSPPLSSAGLVSASEVVKTNFNASNNKLLQEVKRDERRATQFGLNPQKLARQLSTTRTVPVFSGTGKDKVQTGTRQVTGLSKSGREAFEKAQADFESRGGSKATAEVQARGGSGGTFQTVGDFGGGGAQIPGVKPLGG